MTISICEKTKTYYIDGNIETKELVRLIEKYGLNEFTMIQKPIVIPSIPTQPIPPIFPPPLTYPVYV